MVSSLSRIIFLVILSCLSSIPKTSHSQTPQYLKLRLLHKPPTPTPSLSLVSDSHRISSLRSRVISGASTGSGQYFVDFRVGSPPQTLLLVADTGSDLVWSKCSACRNCSRHAHATSFLPRHSSTFSPFHCYSRTCRLAPPPLSPTRCNRTRLHSTCRYGYSYADRSRTSGFFSHDVATLNSSSGRQIKLRGLAFGCGFSVSGPSLGGAHGVMGLGRGPISFASQIGRRFGKNKFSYCLMDYTISPPPSSYLMIGEAHQPDKRPISFTPLQSNPLSPTFYYIRIESVSIDGKSLPIDPSVWDFDGDGNGGTVIDSGTTLTFLAEPAYRQILTAFRRRVRLPRVVGPTGSGFDLCVNVSVAGNPMLPRLGFRLLGGAAFLPPPRNYFIDVNDGVKCLALQPINTASAFSVIGNLMQQGFLFIFDRDESRLGFSRTGCTLS
ncbi:aspartyl protease family protein 2 [Magnolia sinica]|uniref:aspartyl protease family protein 2 n=1 Tax=Magnolia sinica TaxID=86752 RepID=UPI002658C317|nr:aspartyl protease family protein 2 [Magnolia sinica]